MEPKIVSLGYAVPSKSYTQREIFDSLNYPHHFWRIFSGAAIDKRHFWVPMGTNKPWQDMCEEYKIAALTLSLEAIKSCLDSRDINTLGCIVFVSCTGYQCPSMSYLIAKEMGLPCNTEHIPIIGDGGCAGAAPAIKQAVNYTRLNGRSALAVSCEVCSTCFYPEDPSPDPRGRFQLLRANAIFGDGASAVLIGYDDNPKHPYVLDSETYTDYEHQDALGLEWRQGRLSCILSDQVPNLAPPVVIKCVEPLLARNNLSLDAIRWIICHPGGNRVLDNIRDELHLPEEKMFLSREGLRTFGNCSSASVGMLSKLFIGHERAKIQKGDWVLIITIGSGMNAWAILLRFM